MTGDEFTEALDELGWRKKDFANRVGVRAETISRGMKNGFPAWVPEYFRVVLLAKRFCEGVR